MSLWLLVPLGAVSLWLAYRLVTFDEEPFDFGCQESFRTYLGVDFATGTPEWALEVLDWIEGLSETGERVA